MNSIQITGLLALLGTILFSIGDVLLLAGTASLDDFPRLKPFSKLLSGAEKMAALSPNRMIWGALLGVFAAPLVLSGFWQVYQGLTGANEFIVLTTVLLFATASALGGFVHGTFYFMGEYVQALNKVDEPSQSVIEAMIIRHRKILIISYAPVLIIIIIASILFSVLVATQQTLFPKWMAAVNPVTLTIAWLLIKRILPKFVTESLEGAGFNIAYFIFFFCTTITLWNR